MTDTGSGVGCDDDGDRCHSILCRRSTLEQVGLNRAFTVTDLFSASLRYRSKPLAAGHAIYNQPADLRIKSLDPRSTANGTAWRGTDVASTRVKTQTKVSILGVLGRFTSLSADRRSSIGEIDARPNQAKASAK
jgi:hypothetical protein